MLGHSSRHTGQEAGLPVGAVRTMYFLLVCSLLSPQLHIGSQRVLRLRSSPASERRGIRISDLIWSYFYCCGVTWFHLRA